MMRMPTTKPKTTSTIWCSQVPWAASAAASAAMTLSTINTRSATMMVLTAAYNLSAVLLSPWRSSPGAGGFTPIHTNRIAPVIFR